MVGEDKATPLNFDRKMQRAREVQTHKQSHNLMEASLLLITLKISFSKLFRDCRVPKQLLAVQGPAGRAGIAGGGWQLGLGLSSLLFVVGEATVSPVLY